jgi:4-hydroxybenzoate polyprenyltransferase
MIRRLRLLVVLARPAVLLLLGLFAATGLAQAGHGRDIGALARVLLVVGAFLLFSVACNDLADEAIDRVNLPGDARRPLVAGSANRREMVRVAAGAAVVALAASGTLHWPGVVVTAAGLACSTIYSLRPVRLADRGALASVTLPACYVAVPYLLGIFAVRSSIRPGDVALLAGLYVGFIGRILLKDFRDVRGDALFGKRTFLVRYGRRWTCGFSAIFWTAGAVLLVAAVPRPSPALVACSAVYLALTLGMLRALSATTSHRHEEALISALAVTGRGLIVSVFAYLSMIDAGWNGTATAAVLAGLVGLTAWQSALMARHGPTTELTVAAMTAAAPPATVDGPVPATAVGAAARGPGE